MDAVRHLVAHTAAYAGQFLDELEERPVRPSGSIDELRAAVGGSVGA